MISKFTNPHNMYRKEDAMRVENVPNGIVLPQRACEEEKPMWGLGGVCDGNNKFVELSYYDGNWATHGGVYTWEEEDYCEDTAIYLGVFFKHWGHFLIDLVGRAWYLARHDSSKAKIVYLGDEEIPGNFLEFFELLGIRKDQLLRIQKPTRFKDVIVPEYSASSCVWYTEEYLSIFSAIAEKVKAEELDFAVPEKVYFTRLGFGKAKQSEVGEEYLAAWLSANGYTLVSPEKLSLRQQVHIWNQAKSIACLDGTIPLNVNFSNNKDLQLLVMHKTSLEHQNLEMSLLMRPCNVTLLDAYWEPFDGYPKSIGAGPFLLCVSDDVVEYSKQADLVMPFTEKDRKKQRKKSRRKLKRIIVNFKGRLRAFLSKMTPSFIKKALGRGK
ncbi:MAG: glycosyltransferase family 61 protein [Clostridia bacterium]|nr:glycosyltransferase family 61 protein [Clostridia bacterium]